MVNELTFEDLLKWKKQGVNFQLIDVREEEEHEAFNIGGVLIPLADIINKRNQLKIELPIIFYCKRGIRSQIAIQKLHRFYPKGNFYNLKSGIGIGKKE